VRSFLVNRLSSRKKKKQTTTTRKQEKKKEKRNKLQIPKQPEKQQQNF
jgi:hypothetical protein